MKAKLTILGLILVAAFTLGNTYSKNRQSAYACGGKCEDGDKVNICHRTESESNPWEAIQIDEDALDTHLGHGDFLYDGPLKENGKPNNKDKQADEWCEENEPDDGEEPSPSPSPSPRVSPEPSPDPSPEPSPEPSPSPESSPEPEQLVVLSASGPKCTNNFSTKLEVKVGGVGQSGIKVKFSYKAETKEAVTNSNGIAGVDFEFKGNGEVTASADGYPNKTVGVQQDTDCPSGSGGETGEVLGATTGGQVLGAMAGTGSAITDLFSFVFALGSGLVGLGTKVYAQNQKKN